MGRRGSPRVDRQTDGRTENLTRTADRMPDESRRPPGRKRRRRDCENSPREVWAISEVAAQENQTQFYLTLRRTSNSQELEKIDPDTGLQEIVGPSVNKVISISAQRNFSFGACASSELNAAPFRLRWLLAWIAAALSRAVFDGCDYSQNERERSPNRIQT